MRRVTMWGLEPNYFYAGINMVGGIVIFILGYYTFRRFSHEAMERL
jgi:ABC-type polysaccharide/polyol phosphate export permease